MSKSSSWRRQQLGTVQGPHACGQTPRLPAHQRHEDAHPTGAQVATENLSQDCFSLRFLVSETSHTSVDHTSHATLSSFIHPHTLCIHVLTDLQKERGTATLPTYSVHTFCTLHKVHSVCSPFTLVVNPLLTTIAPHIFSSDPAEPH